MNHRLPIALILTLAACGDAINPQTTASHGSVEPGDMVALSREAVEDSASSEAILDEEPAIALSDEMLTDAVPLAESIEVVEPEIVAEPEVVYARFELRRGETLDHFARWSGFPVEDVAEFSELDLDGAYAVGTEVLLPIDGDALSEFERSREDHWTARVDGYLASRGGADRTEFYKVRTGDSAWGIAQDKYSMPIWMLEAYNPSIDLDRLRPGQELLVPVLGDTVVDAEPSE